MPCISADARVDGHDGPVASRPDLAVPLGGMAHHHPPSLELGQGLLDLRTGRLFVREQVAAVPHRTVRTEHGLVRCNAHVLGLNLAEGGAPQRGHLCADAPMDEHGVLAEDHHACTVNPLTHDAAGAKIGHAGLRRIVFVQVRGLDTAPVAHDVHDLVIAEHGDHIATCRARLGLELSEDLDHAPTARSLVGDIAGLHEDRRLAPTPRPRLVDEPGHL